MPSLKPIGQIRTPYQTLEECPRNVDPQGPSCEMVIDANLTEGLIGLARGDEILVLYWFEHADRSITSHMSRKYGEQRGVFSLRTQHRPNPVAAAVVRIESIEDNHVFVNGLDCLDRTPLLDIKPEISRERLR